MGVHQEFAGCLVRMGCNASDRTTGRYVCVSITVMLRTISAKFAVVPSTSLFTCVSPLTFQAKKAAMHPWSYNS